MLSIGKEKNNLIESEDAKNDKEVTAGRDSPMNTAIICTISLLVICILSLTYGTYNLNKAINNVYHNIATLSSRIDRLENKDDTYSITEENAKLEPINEENRE